MKVPSEEKAIQDAAMGLAELVGVDRSEVRVESKHPFDGLVIAGPFTFVIEWKSSGLTAQVSSAIQHIRRHGTELDRAVPVILVPFMGDVGQDLCAEADVSWLDLSGNARIFAPGLRIMVEGKPNKFKRPGRPSSTFAPNSSRITRWLLMNPHRPWTQRELSTNTDTDEGYTSRIVSKLERDGLIVRDRDGAIMPKDPEILLEAWREKYDFTKHNIIMGHVAARSGDTLLKGLADSLGESSVEYAVTGLAAAWVLDRFAAFRTTTLYLVENPTPSLLKTVSFRKDERGANVWLVVPNDVGVFHGATEVEGIRCAHPVQVYLDLDAHPERANEAAESLRAAYLNWKTDG